MSDGQRAVVFDFFHDTFHQRGLPFAVLSYESDFVAPFYHQVGIAEDRMVAVCFCHVFDNHRIRTGAGRGRELQAECRCVFLIHFKYLKFFKHFDTALYL